MVEYWQFKIWIICILENNHKKYNYNERNEYDFRTALHFAAKGGKIDVTKFLVEQDANVIATTNIGTAPYDYAVQEGKEEVAEYLKEKIIALINEKDTFSEEESK